MNHYVLSDLHLELIPKITTLKELINNSELKQSILIFGWRYMKNYWSFFK